MPARDPFDAVFVRHIAERTGIGEQRESLFAVTIPERAGSLLRFCDLIGTRAITEFNYRYADVHIFVGVEIHDSGGDKRVRNSLAPYERAAHGPALADGGVHGKGGDAEVQRVVRGLRYGESIQ